MRQGLNGAVATVADAKGSDETNGVCVASAAVTYGEPDGGAKMTRSGAFP